MFPLISTISFLANSEFIYISSRAAKTRAFANIGHDMPLIDLKAYDVLDN